LGVFLGDAVVFGSGSAATSYRHQHERAAHANPEYLFQFSSFHKRSLLSGDHEDEGDG
jgi:hypothetical protein